MKINGAVLTGLFAAVSIVLGIAENFIPMPLPAIRLGLSNVPVMMMLYLSSARSAFAVLLLKSFLVPVFSGNMIFKLSLGLPSGLAAFVAMLAVLKLAKNKVSPISVGVTGAFAHMFIQLAVASSLYIKGLLATNITGIFLLIATITGVLTGVLTDRVINRQSVKAMFGVAHNKLCKPLPSSARNEMTKQ